MNMVCLSVYLDFLFLSLVFYYFQHTNPVCFVRFIPKYFFFVCDSAVTFKIVVSTCPLLVHRSNEFLYVDLVFCSF